MTIAEQIKAEGKAEGIAEGKAEGIAEGTAKGIAEGTAKGIAEGTAKGKAEVLIRLLTLRFGALPDSALRQISAAGSEELGRWAERVLTATTLQDVLGA